jgi:lambda repressor-like predicted transcriptional regulator
MRRAFGAAAQTLGMSVTELRTSLRNGETMTSLAQSKGVSTDTLKSSISAAIAGSDSALSGSQADEIAASIVAGPAGGPDRPAGPPPGGGHGGPPPALGQAMGSLAETLGISEEELLEQLQSGESLTSVAAAKGMDASTLKSTLVDALTKADSSLSTDQAGGIADRLIEGPPRPQLDTTARFGLDQAAGAGSTSNLADTGGAGISEAMRAKLYALYQQLQALDSDNSTLSTVA